MSSTIKVYITNLKRFIEIEGGSTVGDVAESLSSELGFKPICAHVNNKNEPLSFPIYASKDIEFLDVDSPSGRRTYVRSLCMMLYYAVNKLYPQGSIRIEHSISNGYFCRIENVDDVSIDRIIEEMHLLVKEDLPFHRHEGRTTEVCEIFTRQGLTDKVRLLKTIHDLYTVYYTLGNLADTYYGCLAPSTGYLPVFSLIQYEDGYLLSAVSDKDRSKPAEYVCQHKMFKAFHKNMIFNKIVGVSTVGELNEAVEANKTTQLINVAEALHNKDISSLADQITERYHNGGARVILVAGPSSSGKTTTTKRLAVQLMTNFLRPVTISLDNYYLNIDQRPLDEHGEIDYESIYALDLQRLTDDVKNILAGKEVATPIYSFDLGRRIAKTIKVHLGEGDVLILEGIHGLNPELLPAIPDHVKFRIYVSALTTLAIDHHNWVPTTDNRLLRRIVRDYKYRRTSALETLQRWPSVRRGEEKWIYPFQEYADATFNSSLIFEMGVMRDFADNVLRDVPSDKPEYALAYRLRKFLGLFRPIPMEMIPPTSLLREFLGGSAFHY